MDICQTSSHWGGHFSALFLFLVFASSMAHGAINPDLRRTADNAYACQAGGKAFPYLKCHRGPSAHTRTHTPPPSILTQSSFTRQNKSRVHRSDTSSSRISSHCLKSFPNTYSWIVLGAILFSRQIRPMPKFNSNIPARNECLAARFLNMY